MSLATNALITYHEFQSFMADDSDNSAYNEDQITLLINAASVRIEKYCNRVFVPSTEVNEIFSGDGLKDYFVKNRHITALDNISYLNSTGGWTELAIATYPYTYDGATGRVWFNTGHRFTSGDDNYRITYTYGYATADCPVELKQACATLVQRKLLKIKGKEGISSESFGDATTSFNLDKMPTDLKEDLQPYRRLTVV